MKKFTLGVMMAVCAFSSVAFAETKDPADMKAKMDPKMMEAFQKATTPGEEHKLLQRYVGKWEATSQWWMKPDSQPETSKGTSEFESMFGGRFVRQTFKGTSMGQPFEGLGINGFDNIKGQYTNLWMDNMGTATVVGTGSFEKAKNAIVDQGEFSCPMAKDGTRSYRSVWTLPENNKFTYEMFSTDDNGKEFRMMKIDYTKVG